MAKSVRSADAALAASTPGKHDRIAPVTPMDRLWDADEVEIEVESFFDGPFFAPFAEQMSRDAAWDLPGLRAATRPGDRVLDVGCGGGRVSLELAAQCSVGHIIGVEPSSYAREVFRQGLDDRPAAKSRVEIVAGDVCDDMVELPTGVDLAVFGDVTLNYFVNDEAALRLFDRLSRHLAPGGRIAAAIFSDAALSVLAGMNRHHVGLAPYYTDDGHCHIVWCASLIDLDARLLHRTYFVQFPDADGKAVGSLAELYDRLWTPSTVEPLLTEAGFEIVTEHPSHQSSGRGEGLPMTVLVARRADR